MAIYVRTSDSHDLLDKLNELVEEQSTPTWTIDSDGDFTHVSQWKDKAWFKPVPAEGQLNFGLIGRKDEAMTKTVYAIYHGRFSELLLSHFDDDIETLEITPKGIEGLDSFK